MKTNITNSWLALQIKPLLEIKRVLTKCEFLPEYESFPSRKIQYILNGAEAEITRLQNENDKFKNRIDYLTSDRSEEKTDTPKPEAPDSRLLHEGDIPNLK